MKDSTREVLFKIPDVLFNHGLKKYALGPNVIEIIGDRGAGKSTLFALMIKAAKKEGLKVYCQYPYKDCNAIPVIDVDQGKWKETHFQNAAGKWVTTKEWIPHITKQVDKHWLYNTDLSDSLVLIDEASTLWPARDFKNWSLADSEFFNLMRKRHMYLVVCTQYYDGLDINVHRSTDEMWFLWKKNSNTQFTHIDCYSTRVVPVEDLQKAVKLSRHSKEFYPLDWQVCSCLNRSFTFYRRPYYSSFNTDFYYGKLLEEDNPVIWDSIIDFESSSARTDAQLCS